MDENLLKAVSETVWAIRPGVLAQIVSVLGREVDEQRQAARLLRPGRSSSLVRVGSTSVIPILGIISHRPSFFSFFGGTSTQELSAKLSESLEDSSVKAIVLDIDSPGGTVDGVDELATRIRAARERKPVVAVANTAAASAAYYLASAASEIVATPSGEVGSIGVFAAHHDFSEFDKRLGIKTTLIAAGKFKVEGNPFEPLSDEARAHFQTVVDGYYGEFVAAVAKGRGVSVSTVRSDFGQGRMLRPEDAQRVGMIDRVEPMDATLLRLAGPGRASIGNTSSGDFTIRDFEVALREIFGFSNRRARAITARGYAAQAQGSPDEQEKPILEALEGLRGVLKSAD